MARQGYEEDWDDEDVEELEIEEEPGILTTTRILVGLLVVVIVTIVVARLLLFCELLLAGLNVDGSVREKEGAIFKHHHIYPCNSCPGPVFPYT